MSGALSRRAAGDLLHLTLDRRRTLDDAMATSQPFGELEGSDRAFARAITSAALRHLGWIDAGIQPLLSRPLAATGAELRALIRAGAAQIWFQGVAPHAAVNATVDAARLWPAARSGGSFLNAALRRVAETPSPAGLMPPDAVWPDWLRRAMIDSLGTDGAAALAFAGLTDPPLHLTAKQDPASLAAAVGGRLLESGSVDAPPGRIDDFPGFVEGDWWVQDQAAALPARLLAPAAGEPVLDLCAAPGGKTMQLASMGAVVTALDRSAPRLGRLSENLARTGLVAEIITADAETWRPAQLFPKILLDAPCSALGTLRRHPEGAWIKSAADIARFPEVQARLLRSAAGMLAPGGTLVYCVCTPLSAEGEAVVARALGETRLVLDPVGNGEIPGFRRCLRADGTLLTLQSTDQAHDAFYIARLTSPPA